MDTKTAIELTGQGIMLKHPHCNGFLMMNAGFMEIHRVDGRVVNLGNPNDVAHILSNIMTDEWSIVTLKDLKFQKNNS